MNIINKVIEELTNIRQKIDEMQRKNDALQASNDILSDDLHNLETENAQIKRQLIDLKHSFSVADKAATLIIKEQDLKINILEQLNA